MENKCSIPHHSALAIICFLPCRLLPALPPARWGCLPFFKKNLISFPPPKNSRQFSKNFTPSHIHLTPHILRTVSHLASYHSEGITFSAIYLER